MRKVRGCLGDKEAVESVYTSLAQDPVGVTGWECLERLDEKKSNDREVNNAALFIAFCVH